MVAMALRHSERLCVDRVADGAAQAAAGRECFGHSNLPGSLKAARSAARQWRHRINFIGALEPNPLTRGSLSRFFFADKSGRIVQFPTRESGSTPLNKLIRVKETLGLKIY
jgi:hypothetical protein